MSAQEYAEVAEKMREYKEATGHSFVDYLKWRLLQTNYVDSSRVEKK